MKQYNMAMLGAGKIAYKMSEAINACEDRIIRYGAASRDVNHAKAFAAETGFQKVYESFDELVEDEKIDFVYVSTPTQMHYEHVKKCLLAGKHVLCEKPFALNINEAKELIDLAEERNLICMDAMWSMYMPMWDKIDEMLQEKCFGKIKFLTASFGYPSLQIPRLLDKRGGGSLYDLGVYTVTAAKKILGSEYTVEKAEFEYYQDVDIVNKTRLKIQNARVRLHSSIKHRDSYMLGIVGTKGMLLSRKFWLGKSFLFWKYPMSFKKYSFTHEKNGYEYELKEIIRLLDEKKLDSKVWNHKDTLDVMSCMDAMRAKAKRL